MNPRDSNAPPPSSLQHQQQQHQSHHHQPPPGMMMQQNSYAMQHQHQHQHQHHNHHHIPDNNTPANNSNNVASPDSVQQRFLFNSSDQFGDGSSASGGFRAGNVSIEPARKKRGRPRKYSPSSDGNIGLALAPAPVSGVSGGGHLEAGGDGRGEGGSSNAGSAPKKHRGRPPGSGKKQMDALGVAGVGFTPHVIIVKAGEDVASKMTAFSQQGSRGVIILSANGAISHVTIRQAMAGGTVTYEGRFEIISFTGNFKAPESTSSTKMTVSLAGSDGRVLGGVVAGALVAATPVQVVVGSFIITDGKKSKSSSVISPSTSPLPTQGMLTFGGGSGPRPGAGMSPSASEGPSSESSEESGGSPLHHLPGSYNNNNNPTHSQPQPMPIYSNMNMGWPHSTTMNMLPN